MRLRDKVAIVTGAGRGIGRAIALAFAREGAHIAAVSCTAAEVEATANEVEALGRKALCLPGDVSVWTEVTKATTAVIERFGTVDILVNNAGIQGPIGPMVDNDCDHWVETMMVNLGGTFYFTKAVLPEMIRRGQGRIINLSGGGAVSARPNFSAYSASKAAIVRLTECLSEELKPLNIQVNAISPGGVYSALTEEVLAAGERAGEEALREARRLKETEAPPQPAASLAVFLAAPESAGLSGRILSALWDDWQTMGSQITEIMDSEQYTVRRVVPEQLAKE